MGFTREIIWRKCDMNGAICFYYCTCVLIVCLYLFIIGSFWDLIKAIETGQRFFCCYINTP